MKDLRLSTIQRLEHFFFQDKEKLALWFETDNVLLGGVSPNDIITVGRVEKLEKFINSSLDENHP